MTPDQRKKAIAWAKRLERVLLQAPDGIELVTIGDAKLGVFDARAAAGADLHDGRWCEWEVLTVAAGCRIHGVSG